MNKKKKTMTLNELYSKYRKVKDVCTFGEFYDLYRIIGWRIK